MTSIATLQLHAINSSEPIRRGASRYSAPRAVPNLVHDALRSLGPLPPEQILQTINQPGTGMLARWANMPAEDQRRYRHQYDEVLAIKQRLEGGAHSADGSAGRRRTRRSTLT